MKFQLTDLQKNSVKKILLNASTGVGTVLALEMGKCLC